jgi:hypothetical protein
MVRWGVSVRNKVKPVHVLTKRNKIATETEMSQFGLISQTNVCRSFATQL